MTTDAKSLAKAYRIEQKLPTKSEWIKTRGGEYSHYLSYEVGWFVEDSYFDGFKAALASDEVFKLRERIWWLERIKHYATTGDYVNAEIETLGYEGHCEHSANPLKDPKPKAFDSLAGGDE